MTADFALIGHLESWEKIAGVVRGLRESQRGSLSMETVKSIVPWIPPRPVVRIVVRSTIPGRVVRGLYIDAFIPPDTLVQYRENLQRVQDAAACAVREGARIVSLGGFTSIVLEGRIGLLHQPASTAFTTGNTLTAAYIVKGLEAACNLHGLTLRNCRLLVIGSTGDVGSACVCYFAGRVRELLLCARNGHRLRRQQEQLNGTPSRWTQDPDAFLAEADLVISAASVGAPTFCLDRAPPHAIICDAGYPKNIRNGTAYGDRLFYGGMGWIQRGFDFEPDLKDAFYSFPGPDIGHGCMLESVVLALEGRYESYSLGRGGITPDRIEDIWAMAQRHGVVLAPFFNEDGLWTRQPNPQSTASL